MAITPLASLADLATVHRACSGQIPPALVGASITVVGASLWVFGGRPTAGWEMVDSLYKLNINTLTWTKHWPPADPSPTTFSPTPRYFHTATLWNNKLVILGGQTHTSRSRPDPEAGQPPELHTLEDLAVWDIDKGEWSAPKMSCADGVAVPVARYAHLAVASSVADEANPAAAAEVRLTVLGGQGENNKYLNERYVLDLAKMEWIAGHKLGRSVGGYRSVACASEWTIDQAHVSAGLELGSSSTRSTKEAYEPILMFTNAGGSHPRHQLDLVPSPFAPLAPGRPPVQAFTSASSPSLNSTEFADPAPPGLRFPQAAVVGSHFILSGLHISVPEADEDKIGSFVVWTRSLGAQGSAGLGKHLGEGKALDTSAGWRRLETGKVLEKGSWSRAVAQGDRLIILGGIGRDILEDYTRRETHFGDLAIVSLESAGIYQPPPAPLPVPLQALALATLQQPHLADFEISALDGSLACSRHLLEQRWPWFQTQLAAFTAHVGEITDAQERRQDQGPSRKNSLAAGTEDGTEDGTGGVVDGSPLASAGGLRSARVLSPRRLVLPARKAVVQALVEFVYARGLVTPGQRDVQVLCELLVLPGAAVGEGAMEGLKEAITHVLHEKVGGPNVAAVHAAAVAAGCFGLHIRCLGMMLKGGAGARGSVAGGPGPLVHGNGSEVSLGSDTRRSWRS